MKEWSNPRADLEFLKDKPVRYGFKHWILEESCTGYIVHFNVYTGKCSY